MQTERVTFLTSPDHKAALDAFARASGISVGHMLREASSQYMAEAPLGDEADLARLIAELNDAVPQMRADIRAAVAAIEMANARVDALLAADKPAS